MPAKKKFRPVVEETPQSCAPIHGRGASWSPANRFERLHVDLTDIDVVDVDPDAEERRRRATQYFCNGTKSIITRNNSPDVGFETSLNPYRGCEHGCIYCYARPSHEFLGFSAGIEFESKIVVKPDAPELLEQAFRGKSWQPQVVALAGNTDPYQPLEKRLRLTRRCLEVFLKYRNPVGLITKNFLITRDLDLLRELAQWGLVNVRISITTLDPHLARVMEPRASTPAKRLEALETIARAQIPVGVNAAPIIPGPTDEELPAILREAAGRGAK